MIGLTPEAERQYDRLLEHYERRERPDAIKNLMAALDEASRKIERNPAVGLAAPRPYPSLARPGRAWIKAGRYWFVYRTSTPPVIVGIFFETADIAARAR